MNKIVKIVVGVIGVLSIILLARIINVGDEALKSAAEVGDMDMVNSYLNPVSYVAYLVLAVTVFLVLLFSLKNMASRPSILISTLKNVGAFVVIGAIAYFGFANGVETPMKDGEILSASGSKWVGTGLYLFYFLLIIALGLMLYTGIKKTISK
jgi:hypothetical protein